MEASTGDTASVADAGPSRADATTRDGAIPPSGTDSSGYSPRPALPGWLLPAVLLSVPIASVAWVCLERSSGASEDPAIEERELENGTLTVATFAPRVGLPQDTRYSHTFQLVNHRSSEIAIAGTSKSCTCFGADIDARIIPSGKSAAVTVSVNASGLVNDEATYTVVTETDYRYIFKLRTATYPPVMLQGNANAPVSFGMLAPACMTSTTRRLIVHAYAGSEPPQLRWLPPDDAGAVTCTLTDLGIETYIEGRLLRRNYDLQIDVTSGKVPGLESEEIRFAGIGPQYDDHTFSATVTWNVNSPIRADPPRWILTEADRSNGLSSITLRLNSDEDLPFRVTNITCADPSLKVRRLSDGVGNSHALLVTSDDNVSPTLRPSLRTVTFDLESASEKVPFAVSVPFYVIDRQ